MTQIKRISVLCLPLTVLLLAAGCRTEVRQTRKDKTMESELYIEVIETRSGTHRFGIAYPGDDKTKMETAEVGLPSDGIEYPVTLDGHKITVFCRYRKEEPNKADAGGGK